MKPGWLLAILLFSFQDLRAQWNYDSLTNNPVSTGPARNSSNPAMIADGNGGYFIVWMQGIADRYPSDIYAQHISANGTPLWTPNGIVICNNPADQFWPVLVSDGAGGIIIAWQDNRAANLDFFIYAQRVTSAGNILWANNGVRVTNSFIEEHGPEIISDGAGGAIIGFWRSQSGGLETDVYAQRINSNGVAVWAQGGVAVSATTGRQEIPKMISDGSGGAIFTWMDIRLFTPDIYAQRINSNGIVQWATNGIAVCTAPNDQQNPRITTNNLGGAIITWSDFRVGIDIYAQQLTSAGVPVWTANGVPVCTQSAFQVDPIIVSDGVSGAIITWYDQRIAGGAIYAQRVAVNGSTLWQTDGRPVCTLVNQYSPPLITAITGSGAVIGWEDKRNGVDPNLYVQKLDANGNLAWTTNGIPVCSAVNDQVFRKVDAQSDHGAILFDGTDVVLAWTDRRHSFGSNFIDDIYISKLADAPLILPAILNVSGKCLQSPTSKGKLQNPPTNVTVAVTVDGTSVSYTPADSSFTYYINGTTPAGNHVVRVKYYNFAGSTIKDSSFVVSVCTGVGNNLSKGVVRLFPNPTSEYLVIDSLNLQANWKTLQIFNSSGQRITEHNVFNKRNLIISTRELISGVYFIVLVNDKRERLNISFVKQ